MPLDNQIVLPEVSVGERYVDHSDFVYTITTVSGDDVSAEVHNAQGEKLMDAVFDATKTRVRIAQGRWKTA